jgi:antitoxin VapB
MPSPARRQQRAITIRSDHALARLALLTRDGRSQVQVIEEALDRMHLPRQEADKAERRARIEAILATVPKKTYPTMAELDALEYDEEGNCR